MLKEIIPFWTSIFTRQLDLDNNSIRDGILKEHKENPAGSGMTLSNMGGWQSPVMDMFASHSSGFMKPLLSEVCNDVKTVADTIGVTSKLAPSYWFNINKKYNYNNSHSHAPFYFSAVYYVQSPENSGILNFERPDLLRDTILVDNITPYNYGTYWVPPTVGVLYIFPSYLKHFVTQNLADEKNDERISIAFNFR
jgi:uncharacterized protein (TIGR02466 family)